MKLRNPGDPKDKYFWEKIKNDPFFREQYEQLSGEKCFFPEDSQPSSYELPEEVSELITGSNSYERRRKLLELKGLWNHVLMPNGYTLEQLWRHGKRDQLFQILQELKYLPPTEADPSLPD